MNFLNSQTEQKLRGGYYTPDDLATFLVRWVAGIKPKSILEPSCGDGVFLDKSARHLNDPRITCFELNQEEAAKASERAHELDLRHTSVITQIFSVGQSRP